MGVRYNSDMVNASLILQVKTLSPADRLELIGAVWETLSPNEIPLTEQEKHLLNSRLEDMEANPQDESPWSEVKKRLESSLLPSSPALT